MSEERERRDFPDIRAHAAEAAKNPYVNQGTLEPIRRRSPLLIVGIVAGAVIWVAVIGAAIMALIG